jgi:hypothetical protein
MANTKDAAEGSAAPTGYTSGPWRTLHVPGDCWDIVGADLTTVAEAVPSYPDARLMAVAPLLLAALRPFANLCEGDMDAVGGGTVLGFDGRLTAGMIKSAKNAIAAIDV